MVINFFFKFECCGANNYSDFDQSNNVWTDRSGSLIPRACCKVSSFFLFFYELGFIVNLLYFSSNRENQIGVALYQTSPHLIVFQVAILNLIV